MSDHDAQGPIDKAYAQAEAMLDDEGARAARRARVLGAVASDAQAAPRSSMPLRRRVSWAAGGWLAAASVAGVSVLVALELVRPPVMRRPSAPAQTPVAADEAPAPMTTPAVEAAPPAPRAVPQRRGSPPADVAVPPPSAFPAPASKTAEAPRGAPAPPPPPTAPQAAADSSEALVVTGEAAAAAASMARMESARAPTTQTSAATPPAVQTARLHAAAVAGRLAELTSLLAQGTPVDAPDNDGETALMKSIQARNVAAAAFLRRHGASLDRPNRAGVSARDMAASIDDPELNQALDLQP